MKKLRIKSVLIKLSSVCANSRFGMGGVGVFFFNFFLPAARHFSETLSFDAIINHTQLYTDNDSKAESSENGEWEKPRRKIHRRAFSFEHFRKITALNFAREMCRWISAFARRWNFDSNRKQANETESAVMAEIHTRLIITNSINSPYFFNEYYISLLCYRSFIWKKGTI